MIYDHLIEQHRGSQPSFLSSNTLEMEGFDALRTLAEQMRDYVLAAHAERFAPVPEYEVARGFSGLAGGAGIMWYIKKPHDPGDIRTDAYGKRGEHYEMARIPGSSNPHSEGYLHSYNLDEMMLWADLFNFARDQREKGYSELA